MFKRYDNWDIIGFDRDKAALLCNSAVNPLVAVLLASRGITEPGAAASFLSAENEPYHDPFLMTDMVKAAERIQKAVTEGEFIAIYGDYDVDGMTSAALLALWLESKGARYEIYIPGRFDEGYGLNTGALDTLKEKGAGLVVTVDCGITAIAEAEHAKKIGLDLVITDHHECRETLPDAVAVVDPKRPDCPYPFKSLAGVGVVFKLVCALEGGIIEGRLFDLSGQFAALGTVADVMPVTGENRKLIRQGLDSINANPAPGLAKLINDVCPEPSNVSASTISYTLAPRLNAAGRMSDPLLSVKLLLSRSEAEAGEFVTQLNSLNDERQRLQQEIYDSALALLGDEAQDGPIVLAGDGWYQGVTGIVAAKLAERFKLPVVIISIGDDGLGRGSCRSFGAFSIYEALCGCADILVTYGGHEMAAGITIAEENIDALRERVARLFLSQMPEGAPASSLAVDFEVEKPSRLLTLRNVEAIDVLKPFGKDNLPPCLCITGAALIDVISIGGGRHTKLHVDKDGYCFECIFFSVSSSELGVHPGDKVDIAFEPQINEFRDRKSVQLQLVDIRKSGDCESEPAMTIQP